MTDTLGETIAVIFDVDGLIADTEDIYCHTYNETLGDYGSSIEREAYTACVGHSVEENSTNAVRHFRLPTTPQKFSEDWMRRFEKAISIPGGIALMPGILDLADHLVGRYPLAVASSTRRPRMITTLQNSLLHNMDAPSLDDVFEALISGSDVVHQKPAPDIYLLAAEQLNVAPEKAVVFEDSEAGVIAGKSAGMTVIAVPNFFTSHQNYSRADYILDSLQEALDLL